MIQCPICQVLNEDSALFCAECGQRFNQQQGAPPQQQQPPHQPPLQSPQQPPSQLDTLPPDATESRPKSVKLRSPMLGGSDADDEGYDKPQLGKLRGTGGSRQEGSTTGRKHLRSPLLGGDDDDVDEDQEQSRSGRRTKGPESQESTGSKKKRLRSPLLGEDDDDDSDDEDFTPESGPKTGKRRLSSPLLGDDNHAPRGGGAKKGSLHSPLLGGGDDDYDDDEPPQRPKKGLRSPMLGGSEGAEPPHASGGRHRGGLHSPLLGDADYDDDDEPPPPRRGSSGGSTTGGKPKLRSSLLGGGSSYDDEDEYDDDWDEDGEGNANVLRSPLLAAKRKRPKPEAAPPAGVYGANPELPAGVQIHKQEPPQSPPEVRNYLEQNPQASHQQLPPQPQQQHSPPLPGQMPGAPTFPGPPEPQPPWQAGGAPPLPGAPPQGWPAGAQPQPGQPWPPPGQPQPLIAGAPASGPPLPAEPIPGAPPWQSRTATPPSPGLALEQLRNAGSAEVSPIVDDNDEFQLDIPEPAGYAPAPPTNPNPPQVESPLQRALPQESQRSSGQLPTKGRGLAGADNLEEEGDDGIPKEKERRNRVERRKLSDRRFTALIDEKGSSSGPPSYDDDYSIGRPQASANAGLAKIMFGIAALALGFKIYEFMKVMGMWDLSKLPEFVAEQMFSGLAIICLIVLALSCMKK